MDWSGRFCYGLMFGTTWSGAKLLLMVYSSLVCDGEDFGTYGNGGGVREK